MVNLALSFTSRAFITFQACPGFIGIFSEKDIPGVNSFVHGNKKGEVIVVFFVVTKCCVFPCVLSDGRGNN